MKALSPEFQNAFGFIWFSLVKSGLFPIVSRKPTCVQTESP